MNKREWKFICEAVFNMKNKEVRYSYKSLNCVACGARGSEGHHVKTRGSGSTDDHWNLMPLDRKCHTEVHQVGLNKFSAKYRGAQNWLLSNDWSFCEIRNKWKHN